METIGHIKIGGKVNGLPETLNGIKLTKTHKDGENFVLMDQELHDSIKVNLPWVYHTEKNLKVAMLSFVIVNNIYKYRAELTNEGILLFPIQPYFNHLTRLPVIKLTETWESALNFKMRAIAYFFIDDKLFDFKTESKFSIENMQTEFKVLDGINCELLAQLDFTLSYKTKLFKTKNTDQVSYLSLSSLNPRALTRCATMPPKVIASIRSIEKKRIAEELEDIKNAITLEEASTFFNSKMIIELDSEENNLFVNDIVNKIEAIENITEKKVIATEKKKEDEAKIEDNIDIVESLITNGVAVNVARALVKKLGSEALEKASEVNFEMTSLIKMI